MRNRRAKHEMEGQRFQMGGTTDPTLVTALLEVNVWKFIAVLLLHNKDQQ